MRKKKRLKVRNIWALSITGILFIFVFVFSFKTFLDGIWDAKSRFTIVVNSDPLFLLSIEPNTNQATLLVIPSNTVFDVPYGYNTYPANSVYNLGQLDSKKGGGKLLSKSIENTFGVMVDGFIASGDNTVLTLPSQQDELYKLKKDYFSIHGLPGLILKFLNFDKKLAKNISFIDTIRIWSNLRSLRNDRISIIYLDKGNSLSEEKLADGSMVKVLNKEFFDQSLAVNFQDRQVRLQNLSIEVVNATGKEKIASQFSRMLQNLGANVVVKSTAVTDEDFNCRVYSTSKVLLSSIISKRLEKYFKCSTQNMVEKSLSDIKVVLGKEFIK